ncbi:MAG: hypothetical protein KIS96_11320 [Bauldia sp.]|nr:hypothetical protein [Bauldia sp.]
MAALDDDEPPLDPALLRVQAKLRRLMLIAGLTLGLGILAVSVAVIYRLVIADNDPPSAAVITADGIPGADIAWSDAGLGAGAELLSVALSGDRMALVFADAGRTVTLLVDTRTMAVIGRLGIGGAAP